MQTINQIQKEYKKRDFIIDNLMKSRGIYSLVARPKVGKSLFGIQLSHSVATNAMFLGYKTMSSPVLYISTEMDRNQLASRVQVMNLDFKDDNLIIEDDKSKINIIDLKVLISDFVNTYNGRLVIVDMLCNNDLARGLNINDYQEISTKLLPIFRELTIKYDVTFLLIHHTNKNNTTLGSTAIDGSVDGIFTLTEDKRYKNNFVLNYTSRDYPSFEIPLKRNENLIMELVNEDSNELPFELVHFLKFAIIHKSFEFTCSDIVSKLNILITPSQFGKLLNANLETLKNEGAVITKRKTSDSRTYTCEYNEVFHE